MILSEWEYDELCHIGVKQRSGRYPYGSGERPYQDKEPWYKGVYGDFLANYTKLSNQGLNQKQIADEMGISTTVLRQRMVIAKNELKAARAAHAYRLKTEKGYSNEKIAEILGVTEGTVRNFLKNGTEVKATAVQNTADALKEVVDTYKYIDIGKGANAMLGVSPTNMDAAVRYLRDQGYESINIQVEQAGTGFKTTVQVLAPPGTTYKDVVQNKDLISPVAGKKTMDNGQTYSGTHYPYSLDPKRIAIRYAEDGGTEMDGTMLIRPGVEDLNLGNSRYAQVRILVDDDNYLKGMAMYSDDLPDGVDVLFNTNKHKGTPMLTKDGQKGVLKSIKGEEERGDPNNPFGATINAQSGVLNIVNDEGDWSGWKKSVASQMLSKQPVELVKRQLNARYADRVGEYEEIMSIQNPAIRKKLLDSFADTCDGNATDLKAAAFPGQASHVILPFTSIKETEIYAPNYQDGDSVVLIRYPHGGIFEIPRLTVNNKNPDAKKTLGNARDAVGINSKVAELLSGADFDGDTVLVIPDNRHEINRKSPLEGLKNFDPKEQYPAYEGMPKVGKETGFKKGFEMGSVSNLITDMTLKGADDDEVARAVRHSMVVIDAEKHNLNWRQSYKDNGIAELKEKYQGGKNKGASTIVSRSTGEVRVPQQSLRYTIDPLTGKKTYLPTGETYIDKKTGKEKPRTSSMKRGMVVDDAMDLVSDNPTATELEYAQFANRMKALANEARKEMVATPNMEYSPNARKVYQAEYDSLNEKIKRAETNAPYERQAQLMTEAVVKAAYKANPNMEYAELKRLKGQTLTRARDVVGSRREKIIPTAREWEAINAGAITNNMMNSILKYTDMDEIKAQVLPKPDRANAVSVGDKARIKAMAANGFTQAQIARQLGLSPSTVSTIVRS